MPHADASTFRAGISKAEVYAQVLSSLRALMDGQRNWVCNLANASSLLWHAYKSLPPPSNAVNWAGFYTLSPASPATSLVLGPFHGKPACQTIAFGRGVCGAAAAGRTPQLVVDVLEFPGHIACDAESRSEVVVPILAPRGVGEGGEGRRLVGVVDVDCAVPGGFDEEDVRWLEELAGVLGEGCDW